MGLVGFVNVLLRVPQRNGTSRMDGWMDGWIGWGERERERAQYIDK